MVSISASAETLKDLEYGQADGVSLRMDAHIPDGPGPFPAVIIVHGGGWVRGDRARDVAPLFEPLDKAGIAWFSISYRLVDDVKGVGSLLLMGKAVKDVQQAVAHVKAHDVDYRIDAERLALLGESAGAQLACLAALKPGEGGSVRAVVSFYGPSDLAGLFRNAPQLPDSIREKINDSPWANLLMGGLDGMSPVNFVRKDMPPLLLIHGTSDELVPFAQSQEMCSRVREAGASCDLYPVRGGGHGMHSWEGKNLTEYKKFMVDWLQRRLAAER
jgi:alpha-L-fucosidase 2